MIYSTKQLLRKYKNYTAISRLEKAEKIFRISQGVYSDEKSNIADIETFFLTYPNAVLSNESAFLFYELSDYLPEKYTIVTPLKAHKVMSCIVYQGYMQNSLIKIGVKKVKTDFGYIKIFDLERMLIELFRLKTKFSYEYYKEVVGNYRKLAAEGKIDFLKISRYCRQIPRGESIEKTIGEVIL